MSGTRQGGLRAAAKNIANDPLFYVNIGALGGRNGHTGGYAARMTCDGNCGLDDIFGLDHIKNRCSGYKGGKISRRKKLTKETI